MFKTLLMTVLLGMIFIPQSYSKTNEVRFATVAPNGSPWADEMHFSGKKIFEKTGGAVTIKVYDSAKLGDELDYLRKMRSGQVHSGAFTAYGLSQIDEGIRAMELPFMFESIKEADQVTAKMYPYFAERMEKKGFILLGFSTYGQVNFVTQNPIHKLDDLKSTKMWVWEGDPLIRNYFQMLKMPAVEMPITEVLIGLQTGMLDGVYAPPLAAMAFQWWTKTKYIATPAFRNGVNGVLITKKKWQTFTPRQQKITKALLEDAIYRITALVRKDNQNSMDILLKNGFQKTRMDQESQNNLLKMSTDFRKKMAGKIYDEAALTELEKHILKYRMDKKIPRP